jgi:hypothetical protein
MTYLDSKKSVLLQSDIQSFFVRVGSEGPVATPVNKVESRVPMVQISNSSVLASSSRFHDAELEINELWSDSVHQDEKGKTVTNVSRVTAIKVLNSLPLDILTAPEVNTLPSGSITLDWEGHGGDVTLIVSGQFVDLAVRHKSGRRTADRSRFEDTLPAEYISSLKKVISAK